MSNKMSNKMSPMRVRSPILLIVYNRPEKTAQVLEQLQKVRPSVLYVVADGAAENSVEDLEKCRRVRALIQQLDWSGSASGTNSGDFVDSEDSGDSIDSGDSAVRVITQFRDTNLGCGPSVKQAIDWFFSQEEEGIILEDDTVPDPSFFRFCDELLDRYRVDERVGFISGSNHFSHKSSSASYFFARNKMTWGWATWKRAWRHMDYEMSWLNRRDAKNIIRKMSLLEPSFRYWLNAIMSIREKNVSAWDWQWYFSVAAQGQLVIYPKVNLVSNIGFDEDATHTTGRATHAVVHRESMDVPLHHPEKVVANDLWDKVFEESKLQIRFWLIKKYMPVGLKRVIRRELRKIRKS